MSHQTGEPQILSLTDLFAVAYQIEIDAVERYKMLASQMESHNNPELAAVFNDLARAEEIHAGEIRRMAGGIDVAAHARSVAQWKSKDTPEAADITAAHYLMSRHDALQMALAGEERAVEYYKHVVETAADPQIKEVARKFVEEETEHVELCHRLLRKYPPEGGAKSDDPDPAISQG